MPGAKFSRNAGIALPGHPDDGGLTMPTIEKESLHINLDTIDIEEIEVFLQEGSRGSTQFAASCSTICNWWCCTASCGCEVAPDQPAQDEDEMDGVLD